ncbi:unnamed protein product [Kuraishia capsulata CBS 1993]|uniref:Rrn9 domain-containing protein n=1 Tax=Kuraishia capsulata CBS 1993 TaxID=1382522 RepID=W6MN82_9ASCO|nr:uncharacterized protein KUCA_T00003702001 [Kuraishia capsulata CBS 1993]CDK27723.1 unnamed protein product [Kuraishia capsulata CBS 1993]
MSDPAESWQDVKTDAVKVVEVLEDDFRHDLAVHLYSVFLLHLKNPSEPKPSFTRWPLSWEEVPDPKVLMTYIDEGNCNVRGSKQKDPPAEELTSDTIAEELTDPVETLKAELNAVFRKKAYLRIHESNSKLKKPQRKKRKVKHAKTERSVEPIVEPALDLGNEIFDGLKSKIDGLIDGIYERKSTLRRNYAIGLNWRDVLLRLHDDEDLEAIETRLRKMFELNIRPDYFTELSDEKKDDVARRKRIDDLKEAVLEQRKRADTERRGV